MRDTAADLIANGPHPDDEGRLANYLSPEHALIVRMAAMVWVEPKVDDLKSILTQPVCPPYFSQAMAGAAGRVFTRAPVLDLNLDMAIRRALAGPPQRFQGWATGALAALPPKRVVPFIVEWYSLERDPATRRAFVYPPENWGEGRTRETRHKEYRPVVELALRDWYEDNSAAAAHSIHRLPPNPSIPKNLRFRGRLSLEREFGWLTQSPTTAPAVEKRMGEVWGELKDYLKCPVPGLRDTAAGILARAIRPAPVGYTEAFFADKHAVTVRMAALLRSCIDTPATKRGEMKAAWSRVLNDAIAGPVCPPYFLEVMQLNLFPVGDADWILPANQERAVELLLWTLHDLDEKAAVQVIVSFAGVRRDLLGKLMLDWYSIEPAWEARRALLKAMSVDQRLRDAGSAVLALARSDWDKENVRLASEIAPSSGRK